MSTALYLVGTAILILLNARQNLRQYKFAKVLERLLPSESPAP